MPITPKRMPLLGHLDELRKRLMVLAAVLGTLAIAGYFFATPIYNFLVAPLKGVLSDSPAVTLKLLEGMGIRFKLGLWGALIVGSPVIIYETFAFFLPALKKKERVWFMWTFVAAVVLFLGGAAFCYLIILEPSTAWLAGQNGELFDYIPTGADLITVSMYFLLGFGVAFEVPIVVFYLVYFDVVPYDKLAKNWRIVWVAITIVAAMITPDWSPISMGALALAMIGLFQGTILLLRILLSKRIKEQRLAFGEDVQVAVHEMAICDGIVRASVETAQQAGASRINAIDVTIGELTEVIEDALQFAFEVVRAGTLAEAATLNVTFLPATSRCHECSATFTHGRFDAQCTQCGSYLVELVSGREMRIDAIDID